LFHAPPQSGGTTIELRELRQLPIESVVEVERCGERTVSAVDVEAIG
jgi:hypothetical protein